MGIRIEDLPLRARQQAVKKLAEQERRRLAATVEAVEQPQHNFERAKESKYHNEKAERGGLRFDSRKEARRFDELAVMLQAGEIRELKLQPQFTLQESFITPEGERVRAIRYQADFSYLRAYRGEDGVTHWTYVVEDVKSRPTRTRLYLTKKKLMREKLGVCITEI